MCSLERIRAGGLGFQKLLADFKSIFAEERVHKYRFNEDHADVIVPAMQIYINLMRWVASRIFMCLKSALSMVWHMHYTRKWSTRTNSSTTKNWTTTESTEDTEKQWRLFSSEKMDGRNYRNYRDYSCPQCLNKNSPLGRTQLKIEDKIDNKTLDQLIWLAI